MWGKATSWEYAPLGVLTVDFAGACVAGVLMSVPRSCGEAQCLVLEKSTPWRGQEAFAQELGASQGPSLGPLHLR